jgi:hypothetical protein
MVQLPIVVDARQREARSDGSVLDHVRVAANIKLMVVSGNEFKQPQPCISSPTIIGALGGYHRLIDIALRARVPGRTGAGG